MPTEIPSQAIVAIATVVAALITGVIAFVNLTLSKEQKISEMRQAWIDGLRNDLAQFFSSSRFFAIAAENESRNPDGWNHPASPEQVADHRAKATIALYQIRLRLNIQPAAKAKSEPEHKELERLLKNVTDAYNKSVEVDSIDISQSVIEAIDVAVEFSREHVLKKEWERVKRGEESFITLKKWLIPAIVAITAIFTCVILFANFRQ